MNQTLDTWAKQAADVALRRAQAECHSANVDAEQNSELLTLFVIDEVRLAIAEMADAKTHGGPTAALMLMNPFYEAIFFKDAGRRAAESLIKQMQQQQPPG
jgi:hypothetical protein